jgi:alkanesulfonate monooxygenase SsuD/methylene tetrahydromethanopterin reductase-like flavin-dependent oxidoreductase (luciferase family)
MGREAVRIQTWNWPLMHVRSGEDRSMKAGMALSMNSAGNKSDRQVYEEEMRLADMAEPAGFDSIWSLEHHCTGYSMVPSPLQMLSYFAGRTRRVQLGTAVIVLPWHDPLRVAEEIAMLDVMAQGRTIFGFGRGAASVEYEAYRIPMDQARERFAETAVIVRKALTSERFSHQGRFFNIPETSIRPRPISHPEQRFYASTVSPESAEIMAEMGFGVMIVAQRDWNDAAADLRRYVEVTVRHGHAPRPPIAFLNVIMSEDRREVHDLVDVYMTRHFESVNRHYNFADGHLKNVKGYEFYGRMAKTYGKLTSDETAKAKAVGFYSDLQLTGTPAEVLERLRAIHEMTGLDHVIGVFALGGMPFEAAERSFRLFAKEIMPMIRNDPAFNSREKEFAQYSAPSRA